MNLEQTMGKSQKSLNQAKKDGGYFYFVSDKKGEQAALMVLDLAKDSDGTKTFRMGRSMLKEFKKDVRQAVYSQGKVVAGKTLTFEVTKGNAKPAIMKKAFKKSDALKNGLGSAFSLVKSAKVTAAADTTAPAKVTDQDANSEVKPEWKSNPKAVATQTELGLSDQEMVDLLAAEKAFNDRESAFETEEDEETLLQERQAETEARLDELSEKMGQMEEIRMTDPHGARMVEAMINTERIELAKANPISGNAFDQSNLAPEDLAFLNAAVSCGVELLLDRMYVVENELSALQKELLESSSENFATELEVQKSEFQSELAAIQRSLSVV